MISPKFITSSLWIWNSPFECTEVPSRIVYEAEHAHYLAVILVLLGCIFVVPVHDHFAGTAAELPGIGWVLFALSACWDCDSIALTGPTNGSCPVSGMVAVVNKLLLLAKGLLICRSKLITYCTWMWGKTYQKVILWHVGLEVRRITELVLLTLDIRACLGKNSEADTCQKNRKTTHWHGH